MINNNNNNNNKEEQEEEEEEDLRVNMDFSPWSAKRIRL